MGPELEGALARLETALGRLEAAAARHLDPVARRGDLETELGVMQDDRSRLAAELDGASARLARFEVVTGDVEHRVAAAIAAVRAVLEADETAPRPGVA